MLVIQSFSDKIQKVFQLSCISLSKILKVEFCLILFNIILYNYSFFMRILIEEIQNIFTILYIFIIFTIYTIFKISNCIL